MRQQKTDPEIPIINELATAKEEPNDNHSSACSKMLEIKSPIAQPTRTFRKSNELDTATKKNMESPSGTLNTDDQSPTWVFASLVSLDEADNEEDEDEEGNGTHEADEPALCSNVHLPTGHGYGGEGETVSARSKSSEYNACL